MPDEPIRLPQEVENVLREINTEGGAGFGREASVARLQAILATTLSRDLQNLTHEMHSFKRVLGSRIETLNDQIDSSRRELHSSSESATQHSRGLVRVTGFYTFLTACLVLVSGYQSCVAQNTLQAQVEPELIMEVDGTRLAVRNEGAYPVTDVAVDTSDIQFVGGSVL